MIACRSSRREHMASLLAALALAPTRSAAMAPNPLSGTWSAIAHDPRDGSDTRLRLVLPGDGGATLFAVDTGNIALPAEHASLAADAIVLDWPAVGAHFRGRLVTADRIEGAITLDTSVLAARFVRGDRFPVAAIDLAPGPLDAARLERLRALLGAPAMAAGWSGRGAHDVLAEGLRDADAPIPVTSADKWHLGSITKSMTATLVARLVEQGRIGWETSIASVLRDHIPIGAGYREVTMLQLLSHRGGLQRDVPDASARFRHGPIDDPRAERLAYVAAALALPPLAAPGSAEIYSNAGFVVAGAMLEAVSGVPWERLIGAQLFAPLGLASYGFGPPATPGRIDQPLGHVRGDDGALHPVTRLDRSDLPTVLGPCGLVHLSMGDLLRYLEVHRDRPAAFLSASSWTRLHTPPYGGSALGWGVGRDGSLAHAGSNGMWWAEVAIDADGLVFAAAFNAAPPAAQAAIADAHRAARLSATAATAVSDGSSARS